MVDALTLLITAAVVLLIGLAATLRQPPEVRRRGRRPWWLRWRRDTTRPEVAGGALDTAELEAAERALTSRLVAGLLDPAAYQNDMAALASRIDAHSPRGRLRAVAVDRDGLRLIGRLGVALPELAPATLCAAVSLAGHGATVEDLVRLLGLTEAQALRITVWTPGSVDHAVRRLPRQRGANA